LERRNKKYMKSFNPKKLEKANRVICPNCGEECISADDKFECWNCEVSIDSKTMRWFHSNPDNFKLIDNLKKISISYDGGRFDVALIGEDDKVNRIYLMTSNDFSFDINKEGSALEDNRPF